MAIFSIEERVTGWVDDQLAKEDPLGADEWGRHVTMGAMQTPKGDAILWVILITLRSPWLGQDSLGTTTKIPANIPNETVVRNHVTRAVENLRKAFETKKAEGFPKGNGHGQGLPPGLAGKRLLWSGRSAGFPWSVRRISSSRCRPSCASRASTRTGRSATGTAPPTA